MLTGILAFFQAVPALMGGLNNFTNAFYNAKVQITTARVGGDVNVAKQLVSGVVAEGDVRVRFLETVSHSKMLLVLLALFAGPPLIYEWKVVVWDNIVCFMIYHIYGFTPAIKGEVGSWMTTIISAVFGSSTVAGVGAMYFNRKER